MLPPAGEVVAMRGRRLARLTLMSDEDLLDDVRKRGPHPGSAAQARARPGNRSASGFRDRAPVDAGSADRRSRCRSASVGATRAAVRRQVRRSRSRRIGR
jgi:hypothetical protein